MRRGGPPPQQRHTSLAQITVDNIVEEHFSRNPRLVHGLFQWGFIEELGLGVDSADKIELITGDADSAAYADEIQTILLEYA